VTGLLARSIFDAGEIRDVFDIDAADGLVATSHPTRVGS
jgi:hypothetical protein